MTDRARNNLKTVSTIVGILVGILALLGIADGYYSGRIDSVDSRVDGVESELFKHKDNTAIHRTAEESRVYERAEGDRWNQLFRELEQINKRIENLERTR